MLDRRLRGVEDSVTSAPSLSLSPLRPLFLSALSKAKARSSDALATQQQQTILPATRKLRKVFALNSFPNKKGHF